MKKIIAVDLDETLAETIEGVLKYHNYTYNGKHLTKEKITDYDINEIPEYKTPAEKAINRFTEYLNSPERENTKPVQGSYEKIKERSKKGHECYIITARSEDLAKITKQRVDQHFPLLFKDILYGNYSHPHKRKNKSELCKHINATHMIEDSRKYAEETATHNITSYLLKKQRNQHYHPKTPHLIKVNHRHEIVL